MGAYKRAAAKAHKVSKLPNITSQVARQTPSEVYTRPVIKPTRTRSFSMRLKRTSWANDSPRIRAWLLSGIFVIHAPVCSRSLAMENYREKLASEIPQPRSHPSCTILTRNELRISIDQPSMVTFDFERNNLPPRHLIHLFQICQTTTCWVSPRRRAVAAHVSYSHSLHVTCGP